MAAMYAVFHGPHGLKAIAERIAILTQTVAEAIEERGFDLVSDNYFDTITVRVDNIKAIREKAERQQINLRYTNNNLIGISIDETTTVGDLYDLINCFENDVDPVAFDIEEDEEPRHIPLSLSRTSPYLAHPLFNIHRSESQVMLHLKQLVNHDLSLNTSL